MSLLHAYDFSGVFGREVLMQEIIDSIFHQRDFVTYGWTLFTLTVQFSIVNLCSNLYISHNLEDVKIDHTVQGDTWC